MIPLFERFRNQPLPLLAQSKSKSEVSKKDVDGDSWGDHDGPGAGGGYKPTDSFEATISSTDGVKDPKTPPDDSDGPGAGGGYGDNDTDTDGDGPGAGGGYGDSFTVSGMATASVGSEWNLADSDQVFTVNYPAETAPNSYAGSWNQAFTVTTADYKIRAKS